MTKNINNTELISNNINNSVLGATETEKISEPTGIETSPDQDSYSTASFSNQSLARHLEKFQSKSNTSEVAQDAENYQKNGELDLSKSIDQLSYDEVRIALPHLAEKFGIGPSQFKDFLRDYLGDVDPCAYDNIHTAYSPEPLSFLRHLLDKRSQDNLGENGKVFMHTTNEYLAKAEKYKKNLEKYGINIEIIPCGTKEEIEQYGFPDHDDVINKDSQTNMTSGLPVIRDALEDATMLARGSVVGFNPNSNKIRDSYGKRGEPNSNYLGVDWSKIDGLNGLLPMYDMKVLKPTKFRGRFTEYSPPINELESTVNEIVRHSDVELAGFGVHIRPHDTIDRDKEVDAICIHNGRLVCIEAKNVEIDPSTGGYEYLQIRIQELQKQLSIYDTKTQMLDKIAVLPEDFETMVATIKDPTKRFSINEQKRVLEAMGVKIVGPDGLRDFLSNKK